MAFCPVAKANKYAGVDYWVYDWQTDVMTERKYKINAENVFYKQEYCGCAYSLRDSNLWRAEEGMDKIKIGGTLRVTCMQLRFVHTY